MPRYGSRKKRGIRSGIRLVRYSSGMMMSAIDIHGDSGHREALYQRMLAVALDEARLGLAEGGIPVGAALFTQSGELVSRGHNRRVQEGDPSIHGETDAFRRAGRQASYRDLVMVTTLAPC